MSGVWLLQAAPAASTSGRKADTDGWKDDNDTWEDMDGGNSQSSVQSHTSAGKQSDLETST